MDEGLRADDFRRAWPTALSVAMREAGKLTEQIEQAAEKVTAANKDALVIAELLPQMVQALRKSLQEDGEKLLASNLEQLQEVKKEIKDLLSETIEVERLITARTAELERSATKLARERELMKNEAENRKKKWFHFLDR